MWGKDPWSQPRSKGTECCLPPSWRKPCSIKPKWHFTKIDLPYCSMQSTSAILMENMDLYMLNPCSNKIWYARIHFFIFFYHFISSLLRDGPLTLSPLSGSSLSSVSPSRWSSWTLLTLSFFPPPRKTFWCPSVIGMNSTSQTCLF